MRKLIDAEQKFEIVCDNPKCDFTIANESGDINKDSKQYIDVPCPLCGENLLTLEDYLIHKRMAKAVAWVNRWFGWIAYLYPKDAKRTSVVIHCHKGVHIEEQPEQPDGNNFANTEPFSKN